jgi:hypothetical protein
MWLEGNYACDCNRHLFFERGAGNDPEVCDPDFPCGEGRYVLVSVVVNGREIVRNNATVDPV